MSITTATASPASAPRLLRAASCCSGADGSRARTFTEVPGAQPFFYENSNGLSRSPCARGGPPRDRDRRADRGGLSTGTAPAENSCADELTLSSVSRYRRRSSRRQDRRAVDAAHVDPKRGARAPRQASIRRSIPHSCGTQARTSAISRTPRHRRVVGVVRGRARRPARRLPSRWRSIRCGCA